MPYYTDGYLGILVMIYLDIQKSLYRNKSVITCNTVLLLSPSTIA